MTVTQLRHTTPDEDWTLVDAIAADKSPAPDLHRLAVIRAIIACAEAHGGLVHTSWVRPLTPSWVLDKVRGAEVSALASRGILKNTGGTLPSGDRRNRNARRPLYVYRVASWDRLLAEVTL